jgi:hypothetical protein
MIVEISICPTTLQFSNGDTYDPERLLNCLRQYILQHNPDATIETLQVSYRQGGWASVDGCSDQGNELLSEFFAKHGNDENLFCDRVA